LLDRNDMHFVLTGWAHDKHCCPFPRDDEYSGASEYQGKSKPPGPVWFTDPRQKSLYRAIQAIQDEMGFFDLAFPRFPGAEISQEAVILYLHYEWHCEDRGRAPLTVRQINPNLFPPLHPDSRNSFRNRLDSVLDALHKKLDKPFERDLS
jgi:hypothetical protein